MPEPNQELKYQISDRMLSLAKEFNMDGILLISFFNSKEQGSDNICFISGNFDCFQLEESAKKLTELHSEYYITGKIEPKEEGDTSILFKNIS